MAEIELNVLTGQCLNRRIDDIEVVREEVQAWQKARVKDIDIIVQYGRFLTAEAGKSWYKGRHALLVELPLYIVYHPETALMAGINFLASWNFTASDKMVPYIFGGGGLVYTNLDSEDLSTDYNGNYQGGIGVH